MVVAASPASFQFYPLPKNLDTIQVAITVPLAGPLAGRMPKEFPLVFLSFFLFLLLNSFPVKQYAVKIMAGPCKCIATHADTEKHIKYI